MVDNLNASIVLGIMSGTSLDGLDMALCTFIRKLSVWDFKIIKATTLTYPEDIRFSLENANKLPADELCILDHKYGKWIGEVSDNFLKTNKLKANWIASHGHTVFHQPSKGFTFQIGNGNDIFAQTGIPVIYDFRSLDVALGGQGAPLVPAGDEYLFEKYDYCLNLGGFSNISFKKGTKRIAFDICPVNMGLNYLARRMALDFDENGNAGKVGKILPGLLNQLNNLDFFIQNPPKSLGREWFTANVEPLLNSGDDLRDIFRSFYEHIALQICRVLNENNGKNVLITGGGAKNAFLVELISQKTPCDLVIPGAELIDFKEALIFAFLGYLRVNNIPNVFSTVTGSSSNHCGGSIIGDVIIKK
jgi:anhydro-N-acetylmuramic acid kinase